MKRPILFVDELIAITMLSLGLIFYSLPFAETLASAAFLYLLMCVFFRKYVAVQKQLREKESAK